MEPNSLTPPTSPAPPVAHVATPQSVAQPVQPAASVPAQPVYQQPTTVASHSTSQTTVPSPEVVYQPPAQSSTPISAIDPIATPQLQAMPANDPSEESMAMAAPGAIPHEGDEELVRWQAKEYLEHDRNLWWYVGLAVAALLLMLAGWFWMRAITFVILVPVMAGALVLYVRRPPAILDYTLSRKGIHVNDRLYDFDQFKEFGLIQDDRENSVLLVPRKRFQPGLTVYFPDDAGEAVVDMLASRLPMREIRLDFVDRLTRFLRI